MRRTDRMRSTRSGRSRRLLLVVTTRPLGPGASAALVSCMGELARSAGSTRIALDGLSEDDVRAWLAGHTSGPVDPTLAAFVHDQHARPIAPNHCIVRRARVARPSPIG